MGITVNGVGDTKLTEKPFIQSIPANEAAWKSNES